MQLQTLKERNYLLGSEKLSKAHRAYSSILVFLEQRQLSTKDKEQINNCTDLINNAPDDTKLLINQYKASQAALLSYLSKELKLVMPGHYMRIWMILGMTIFGLPFGVVFSFVLDNMAFIGLGLPIGMPVGMAIGIAMDAQAQKEGRQLNIDNS